MQTGMRPNPSQGSPDLVDDGVARMAARPARLLHTGPKLGESVLREFIVRPIRSQ